MQFVSQHKHIYTLTVVTAWLQKQQAWILPAAWMVSTVKLLSWSTQGHNNCFLTVWCMADSIQQPKSSWRRNHSVKNGCFAKLGAGARQMTLALTLFDEWMNSVTCKDVKNKRNIGPSPITGVIWIAHPSGWTSAVPPFVQGKARTLLSTGDTGLSSLSLICRVLQKETQVTIAGPPNSSLHGALNDCR